jgi:UDP-N-acetylglucosamine 4,6-dehydratase/5-epimerase
MNHSAQPLRDFRTSDPDFENASILVTGGTGSFGRAFTRIVLNRFRPARLIVFSRDELKQYEMQQELDGAQVPIRFFIGDVRDRDRLEMALRGVDYVIHAAALKHVPAAEYNPFECINTNVLGAENVVHAAIRTDVKRVIALSTDKACNPINLYGASKLAADKIFVAANNLSGRDGPRFSAVRYGNVVGSRGSVVPHFRRLAANGAKSLPITDPRMTRFWITLAQGVDFVLSCLATMEGGEIFVPKIPSMRTLDLATAIAPHLPSEPVGVRPGEKLHEVMISDDDSRNTIEMPDRYAILPGFPSWRGESSYKDRYPFVPEGFRYASDTNPEWLDAKALQSMLVDLDHG